MEKSRFGAIIFGIVFIAALAMLLLDYAPVR